MVAPAKLGELLVDENQWLFLVDSLILHKKAVAVDWGSGRGSVGPWPVWEASVYRLNSFQSSSLNYRSSKFTFQNAKENAAEERERLKSKSCLIADRSN